MHRLFVTTVLFLVTFGVALADEFTAIIKKVDGKKVTLVKLEKGRKGEELTLSIGDPTKISEAKFNKETKKIEPGKDIKGGLDNKIFSSGKVRARIKTEGERIVEIQVLPSKKRKKQSDNP